MRWLPVVLLIWFCSPASAQQRHNLWLFGKYAGIDFGKGCGAEVIATSAMHAREGCAAICTEQGLLLAYSNGETVWNRHHRPMPNGRSLSGHISSTQSAIFLPWPNRPDSLLLFTTDGAENSGRNGLRYSVIDLRADRGAGDLTLREQLLHAPTTERLTVVAPCHGRWHWLVSREYGSNRFLCYRIDERGVNPAPVISAVGLDPGQLSTHVLGSLQASSDGRRLVLTHQSLNRVEIFDFDPETGVVSRPRAISSVVSPYGAAFSPNGRLLYVSTRYGQPGEGVSLYQFRVSHESGVNGQEWPSYRFQIRDTSFAGLGSIQLGPDAKLYLARFNNQYLGVVNQPNEWGTASQFVAQGFFLGSRHSTFGLPNIPTTAQQACSRIWVCDSLFCSGDTARLVSCQYPGASWQWFRDGQAINGANQHFLNAAESGNYTVEVQSGGCAWMAGPVKLEKIVIDSKLVGDSVICPGESLVLRAGGRTHPGSVFEWRRNGSDIPDANESSYTPRFPGRYTVKISNRYCTYETEEVRVRTVEEFARIEGDSVLCPEAGVLLETQSHPEFRYSWAFEGHKLPDAAAPQQIVHEPGRYQVEVIYRSCTTLSPPYSVSLFQNVSMLSGDRFMCRNADSARLTASSPWPVERTRWLVDGLEVGESSRLDWLAHRTGRWQAILFKDGCPDTTPTHLVQWLPEPSADINVSPEAAGPSRATHEPVRLTAVSDIGRTFSWELVGPAGRQLLAGREVDHRFSATGEHRLTLTVESDSGCRATARKTLRFENLPVDRWFDLPNAFTPNGDGLNDTFEFSVNQLSSWSFKVFDRWNNLIYVAETPTLPVWNGQLRNGPAPEGVYLYRLEGRSHEGETVRQTGSVHVIY